MSSKESRDPEMVGVKESAGPDDSAGPKDSAAPKDTAGLKEPTRPKESAGPKDSAGSKESAGPKDPAGPKDSADLKESTGPKEATGPKESTGPKDSTGSKDSAAKKDPAGRKDSAGSKDSASSKKSTSSKKSAGSKISADAAIPDFKDTANVDPPALTYKFYLMINHGPPEIWTYNLTRIIAAMVRNTGSPNTAFRIIHLKNSICKRLGVKFGTINLIYRNKILTDTENLFSVGIVDGARLHVLFKTDTRKIIEEQIMDDGPNASKFLSKKERGKESLPDFTKQQKAYQKGNFGLSDTKMTMLLNSMFDNPILIERCFENKLIHRILENHEMRDTIKEENDFLRRALDKDPKLHEMLYGEGSRDEKISEDLKNARNFVAEKENIKNLRDNLNSSTNNILDLCKHIQNPAIHSNPFPKGKQWTGQDLDQSDNLDGCPDAMFEVDSDEDGLYAADGQTNMTVKDHIPNNITKVRVDLQNVWKKYRDSYDYLRSMGLEDDQKMLLVLKNVNGDLSAAINMLFPDVL